VTSRKGSIHTAPARQRRKARSSWLGAMEFYRVPDSLPSRWRSFFVTLTLTGLRLEELRELRAEDLDHEARAILLKSATGNRTIYVTEEFWHWVRASVPLSFTPACLRAHWDAAVQRAGLKAFPSPICDGSGAISSRRRGAVLDSDSFVMRHGRKLGCWSKPSRYSPSPKTRCEGSCCVRSGDKP
jgi:hypothetical protein